MDLNNLDINKILGLDKVEKFLSRFEKLPLRVYPGQCTGKRGDQERSCRLCFDVCPHGAITLNDEVSVDAEKCDGCGFCANVCPSGAFEPLTTDDYLLAHIKPLAEKDSMIAFNCPKTKARHGDQAAVELACLGRLNEVLLIGASVFGAKRLWLDTSVCLGCELEPGLVQAHKAVDNSQTILTAFSRKLEVDFTSERPAGWRVKSQPQALKDIGSSTRRELFAGLYRQALVGGAELISNRLEPIFGSEEKLPLDYRLPRRRELLLMLVRKLGSPSRERVNGAGLSFTNMTINDDCTFCGNCSLFCPTKALEEEKDSERGKIAFALPKCTKCNLCKVVCPTRAIAFTDDFPAVELISDSSRELIDFKIVKCKKCQQPFGAKSSDKTICPFCEQRQAKLKDDSFS